MHIIRQSGSNAPLSTLCVLKDDGEIVEQVSYDEYRKARNSARADVTGDGVVDVDDLSLVGSINWGSRAGC